MNWRKRRQAGVTVRNLVKAGKELKAAGALEGLSDSEVAAALLSKVTRGNEEVLADPSFDWDSILSFIEKLLPLILKLIDLFS